MRQAVLIAVGAARVAGRGEDAQTLARRHLKRQVGLSDGPMRPQTAPRVRVRAIGSGFRVAVADGTDRGIVRGIACDGVQRIHPPHFGKLGKVDHDLRAGREQAHHLQVQHHLARYVVRVAAVAGRVSRPMHHDIRDLRQGDAQLPKVVLQRGQAVAAHHALARVGDLAVKGENGDGLPAPFRLAGKSYSCARAGGAKRLLLALLARFPLCADTKRRRAGCPGRKWNGHAARTRRER